MNQNYIKIDQYIMTIIAVLNIWYYSLIDTNQNVGSVTHYKHLIMKNKIAHPYNSGPVAVIV